MSDDEFLKLLARIRDEGINEANTHGLSNVTEATGVTKWCLTQAVVFRAANIAVWRHEDRKELSFEEIMREAVEGISRKPEALELLCREISSLVVKALESAESEGRAPVFIDVGCGSGFALALIANHPLLKGKDVEPLLIGVDHNQYMVEALRVMLPQAASIEASAESLPLRPNVADAVTSIGMIHEVRDVRSFISSVARTLRDGGEALIADTFAPPLTAALMRAGRAIRVAFRKGPENPWGIKEVLGVLRASGLTVRSVRVLGSRLLRTYPAIIVAVKRG